MVYADYNATTPISPSVWEAMEAARSLWGNPSSTHALGRDSKRELERARDRIAQAIGTRPENLVFTSGGSEANTMALLGMALEVGPGFRLLTSRVEHSSVRDTLPLLSKLGSHIEFVTIDGQGQLDWDDFLRKLEKAPHLVSLMAANNETGVLFPIPAIAEECRKRAIPLHCDAVQALGKLPPSFFMGANLVSLSAHKIYGPKGVGALVLQGAPKLSATHYGGSQERKRRGGTENLIGILGFGKAAEELSHTSDPTLQNHFEASLRAQIPGLQIQGAGAERLGNTSNLRITGIASEILLGCLDLEGACVSAGSACSSGSISPSHVLLEMGLSHDEAKECLRFSWGKATTREEVDKVAALIVKHVLRIQERARNT